MKRYFLLILFISAFTTAQTLPILTANGIEPVITQTDSLSAAAMYKNTINWVNVYFNDPDEVINAEITNEMIRLKGFTPAFFEMQGVGLTYYDVSYDLALEFKDGRYRFSFFVTGITNKGANVLFSEKSFFKKKDGSVKKTYGLAYDSFNISLQALYLSHYKYITGSNKAGW